MRIYFEQRDVVVHVCKSNTIENNEQATVVLTSLCILSNGLVYLHLLCSTVII